MKLFKNIEPKIEFAAQIPLGEFYRLAPHIYPPDKIVAHMAGDDDLMAVFIYWKAA